MDLIHVEKTIDDTNTLVVSVSIINPQTETSDDLICAPIKTLDEVNNWMLSKPHPKWAERVERLEPASRLCASGKHVSSGVGVDGLDWIPLQRSISGSLPKTLFCHDYKGGYKEDRFVNGSNKFSEYRFFHWAGIDTFVYFSHYFVTIPPLMWINSAHLHGVKILGTIITEWIDGMAIWERILEDDASIELFAINLAAICHYFGFEGYLLNIENEIKIEHIGRLESFIVLLRKHLLKLVPTAEVIWYDSVTVDGQLTWQNELNNKNKSFFDACDGIFLNYGWREEELVRSVELAGVRTLDVYVGVDVFGRGVYGGGGFNCDKALELIRKHNLSTALFAPGWVHETQPVEHFESLEYLFWQKVWPYLFVRSPTRLPFQTSFCQGYGTHKYTRGEGVSDPWYNLSYQSYQPTVSSDVNETCLHLLLHDKVALPEGVARGCVQHCATDGFNGGGCLRIQRPQRFSINARQFNGYQRLFVCEFESAAMLLISYATKTHLSDNTTLNLVLILQDPSGRYRKVVLTEERGRMRENNVQQAMKVDDAFTLIKHWKLGINPYAKNRWKQSFYTYALKGATIVEIGSEIGGASDSILLGHLRIQPLTPPPGTYQNDEGTLQDDAGTY